MSNTPTIPPRFEKGLRERIKSKFSFDNYKIDIIKSGYLTGNDISITFSYQRIQKEDFAYMDMSQFDENMIDFYVTKCILNGSFTYRGEYDPRATQIAGGGQLSILGNDLHIESIEIILGIKESNNKSNEDNEGEFGKIWMKKENNEWIEPSDEEYEKIGKEEYFEICFLKNIIDVIQNEIYEYLMELSVSCPDEYRLIGINGNDGIPF